MQDELKVGTVGVRDRLKLYAEECQKKKEIENREKFDTQKLDASMSDITRFDSPTRNKNKHALLGESIGKIESPGVFQFSPEDDPLETLKKNREKKAQMKKIKPGLALDADEDVSPVKPKRSMRPDMMRGRSFEEKNPPRRSSPPRINNMRPGMMRGLSFDAGDAPEKPQKVKNAEEKKAKVTLADLLDEDSKATGKGKDTFQLKSFSTLRDGYMSSIDDLRPEAKPFSVQTKKERKKEAEKVKTYNTLKDAWETYEDTAQDKPDPGDLTPEEEAVEEKILTVETSVNEDWQEYAEEATKVIQDNADSDSDSDSDDEDEWDFWILEAKRLKAEAERKEAEEAAKNKAKAKAKRRKEKEAQRNRLEAEDEDIVEIAKRLKEEARKKKEDEKKLPLESKLDSKANGDNAESNSTSNGKSKSSIDSDSDSDDSNDGKTKNDDKSGKGKKSRFDDDSDDSDSDDATGGKAKTDGKPGKSKSKEDLDDSDSDDAADTKAKSNGKSGKGKKGRFDDDSDSDDAADTKAKPNDKPGKAKKGRFDDDSDDSDSDDAADTKSKKKPISKKKRDDDETQITPATKKKDKVVLKEDALPEPKTPRNQDGTLWKNPLNRWTNKPKKKIKEVNSQIIFKVPEKTDCWRKTRHNFIMDNAPFHWHKVTGDFEAIVKVSGDFGRMYDKAGIMVREDAENWILTGMEFFNKRVNHSTCVTRDFTDWSLSPLPEGSEDHGIWFCIKRVGNSYETFYSLDSKRWIQTRQGIFSDKAVLKVGICCACPMGDEFKVTFEGYRLRKI
jgi:regulation of enolase protein 1 (concanavalin A-like superfamily)